jgi:quinoprotein relay system zinc metallohydrolase 2
MLMKAILSALALLYWSVFLPQKAVAQSFDVIEVAQGIYTHFGRQENAFPFNRGDISNVGFIVGSKGVAVIDTGGSPFLGQQLMAAIRSLTALPILYVINTHVHQDHVMGNVVFNQPGVVFVGHASLAAAMQSRGEYYLKNLPRDVGEDDADHAAMVTPTLAVADTLTLDLGERIITLKSWPTAHTDNDLTVWDEHTKVLWASDLLFVNRIPALDGNLQGWLADLDGMALIPARLVVPGHGPLVSQWPQGLADQRRYLMGLRDDIRLIIAHHGTMEQAIQQAGQSEKDKWLLFDLYNRRNVAAAYAELEWE